MTLKEMLIQELDNVSDPVIVEVIDFFQFLNTKQKQEQEDFQDACAALEDVTTEGTID
mgnify:CR=1 FL=1